MTKVDALLENFVHDTQGELMSQSTVSWRRDNKSAKLDHIITWNLPHDSNAGSLAACWRSVGSGIPEGCEVLDHPELARRLADTPILKQHELSRFLPGLTARSVVKAGEKVFQPVPLGQVDWLGGPRHDHAMVGFRIAPLVLAATLAHTRKYASPARGRTRIRLKDWQRLAPALQKELSGGAEAMWKRSKQGQLMQVQRCKTHYGTDTNWPRAGWRRQSGPENTSNVERHT